MGSGPEQQEGAREQNRAADGRQDGEKDQPDAGGGQGRRGVGHDDPVEAGEVQAVEEHVADVPQVALVAQGDEQKEIVGRHGQHDPAIGPQDQGLALGLVQIGAGGLHRQGQDQGHLALDADVVGGLAAGGRRGQVQAAQAGPAHRRQGPPGIGGFLPAPASARLRMVQRQGMEERAAEIQHPEPGRPGRRGVLRRAQGEAQPIGRAREPQVEHRPPQGWKPAARGGEQTCSTVHAPLSSSSTSRCGPRGKSPGWAVSSSAGTGWPAAQASSGAVRQTAARAAQAAARPTPRHPRPPLGAAMPTPPRPAPRG